VLLLLGVAERAVMGLMGWSNSAMAARYQHLTVPVRRDIAKQVGGLLWDVQPTAETSDGEDDEGGTAGVPARV
jgi:hypothetical protein